MNRLVGYLILCCLLSLGLFLLVEHWESTIRADQEAKTTRELTLAWESRLKTERAAIETRLAKENQRHADSLDNVRRTAGADLDRMRQRASRAEQLLAANRTPAGAACTGDRLAREDAEFLTREAARAAEQQEQLKKATADYNSCADTLRNVTSGIQGDSYGNQGSEAPGIPGPGS